MTQYLCIVYVCLDHDMFICETDSYLVSREQNKWDNTHMYEEYVRNNFFSLRVSLVFG